MTTVPPVPPAEDTPGDARVQMSGASQGSSTFTQVAGDQYNIQLSPAPPSSATCTLPADTAGFTGREKELHGITAVVAAAAEAGRVVAIHAIDGMPGVGKTALAVHVGHLVADRFPDRQLFLDLHAHTPGQQPTTPQAALASLLAADGADARYLPESPEERATLWRDRMAHKRILLILDNAASSDQVAPLLPGSAGCLVLVTSRRYLGDLPSAVPVSLDILPPQEAQQMFLHLVLRVAEPPRVAELVKLCGYLPLAISLLASLFNKHRSWTMGHLITETKTRLLTVAAENCTVAAAFNLSYQDLPSERQRFFRHLGLHLGVDIDAYAAAALADIPLDQARDRLEALHSDRLLDEPVYRRYRMHDLIRDYARTLAATEPTEERDQALDRLLDYYQHTATLADAFLAQHTRPLAAPPAAPPGAAPELVNSNQALAWMRTERVNLLACLDHAIHHVLHARVVGLTAGVASLLRIDGPWTQGLELHATAAAAARRLGNRLSEASALHDLGDAQLLTGDYPSATKVLEQALDLYRDLGNQSGEANALHNLGSVRWLTGDYPSATKVLEQALDLHRNLGNRHGEANALQYLGFVQRETGDYSGAAQVLEQALGLYRDLGDRHGEAYALNNLGTTRRMTGDYRGATQVLEQALGLYRDVGDLSGEAYALQDLGVVQRETGDYSGAAQVLEQALGLYRDLGDRHGEAEVLNHSGTLDRKLGKPERALAHYQRALEIARAVGSPLEEARALEGIGRCALDRGDTTTAVTQLRQALEIYQRIGAAEVTQLATDLADLEAE